MASIILKEGENIGSALKRFRKEVYREGILGQVKARTCYRKPSEKRIAKERKIKRNRKNAKK